MNSLWHIKKVHLQKSSIIYIKGEFIYKDLSRCQPQDFIAIIDMLIRVCSVYVDVDVCESSCLPAGRGATDIYSLIETNIIWSPNNGIAILTSSSAHTHTTNSFSKHLP